MTGALGAQARGVDLPAPGLARRQVRLALTMLIWHRDRLVERDELADLLWPERLPASWEAGLRNVVTAVRSVLADFGFDPHRTLQTSFRSYQLCLPDGVRIDVELAAAALRTAETALAAGRGDEAADRATGALATVDRPLLIGETGSWVEQRRAELADRRMHCLKLLAESRLVADRPREAAQAAIRLVALAPYDEGNHRLLIRAHVAAGDRAAAAGAYEACCQVLADDLGVAPEEATQALYRSLPPAAAPVKAPPALPAPATPFVGRAAELARLGECWDVARSGPGRVVLVGGEAGIGKTRLLAEFAAGLNARSVAVLYGAATPYVELPYGPFAEAFRSATGLPVGPEQSIGSQRSDRTAIYADIAAFLRRAAADRPVLLILDDMHWAGPDSVALFGHLARTVHRFERLLVVAAYRRPEPAAYPALGGVLGELRRSASVRFVELAGLDRASLAVLGEAVAGRPLGRHRLAAVAQKSGGNPFFATELLARPAGHSAVPRAVEDVVAARIGQLSEQTRPILQIAAVVGIRFGTALVSAAADATDAVSDAIDETVAAGLIEPVTDAFGRYRFRHAIVRAAVYNGIRPERRARIHRRIAVALEELGPGEGRLVSLAHHWAQGAPGTMNAVVAARTAGDVSTAALAYAQAAALYRRALDHLRSVADPEPMLQAEILLALGAATKRAGQRVESESALRDAAAMARRLGRPELLARVALVYAGPERSNPNAVAAPLALVEEALAAVTEVDGPHQAALLARRAQLLVHVGDRAGAAAAARTASDVAERRGDHLARAESLAARLPTLAAPLDAAERLAIARELAGLTATGTTETGLLGIEQQAYSLLELGDAAGARAAITEYGTYAATAGLAHGKWFATQHQIMLATAEGRLADVERLLEQFDRRGRRAADSAIVEMGRTVYLTVPRWLQGRVAELRPGYEEIYRRLPTQPNNTASRIFLDAHGGDTAQTRRDLETFFGDGEFDRVEMAPRFPALVFFLATAVVALDSTCGAEALYDTLVPLAELNCVYYAFVFYGSYAYHLGRLALVLGRKRAAKAFLGLALDRHRALRATPWVRLTETALDR